MFRECPEVQEVKSSEVLRLERYLKFHLAEILEELNSTDQDGPDPDLKWRDRWGSAASALKDSLLRSRDEITLALARVQEGTYGYCVLCGNAIDLRRLQVVPWLKLCMVCYQESERNRLHVVDELQL